MFRTSSLSFHTPNFEELTFPSISHWTKLSLSPSPVEEGGSNTTSVRCPGLPVPWRLPWWPLPSTKPSLPTPNRHLGYWPGTPGKKVNLLQFASWDTQNHKLLFDVLLSEVDKIVCICPWGDIIKFGVNYSWFQWVLMIN